MTSEELTERLGEIERAIQAQAESVRDLLAEADGEEIAHDIYAYFPKEWDFGDRPNDGFSGPVPDDAGTVYVIANEKRLFSFSLSHLVDGLLETIGNSAGQPDFDTATAKIHEEHVPAARAIMDALRAAANQIERALYPK